MPKKLTILFLATGLLFFNSGEIYAYDDETTHPALTDEIVDFYNLSGDDKLTAEQKEWLVDGSTLEDTPPRWINHFYDPVNKVAWTGEHAGNISPAVVRAFRGIALSPHKPLTAVEWANSSLVQNEYYFYRGNRTWKKALQYYADGNLKEAYIALGHILHLAEDMTVPEHTRNDPHAHVLEKITGDYGSPYEEYTRKWTRKNLHIAEELTSGGFMVPTKYSIEEYLTYLAEYSNHNFFSKDTINDPKYRTPKITREDGNFGYGADSNGENFPMVKLKIQRGNNDTLVKSYLLENGLDSQPILDAYFSRLSRKAVLTGAGIIRLFKAQAADEVVNKEFPQRLVIIDSESVKWFTFPVISLVGEGARLLSAAQSALLRAGETAKSAISSFKEITSYNAYIFALPGERVASVSRTQPPETKIIREIQVVFLPPAAPTSSRAPDRVGGQVEILEAEEEMDLPEPIETVQPLKPVISDKQEYENVEKERVEEKVEKIDKVVVPPVEFVTTVSVSAPPTSPVSSAADQPSPILQPPVSQHSGASSLVSSGGGGASPAPPPSPPPAAPARAETVATSTQPAATSTRPEKDHAVISEIFFNAKGGDKGREFVELYNPAAKDVDLAGWSLRYRKGNATATVSLALLKSASSSEDYAVIPPTGFLLLGFNNYEAANYRGKAADARRTVALPNGEDDGKPVAATILLVDGRGNEVDRVSYRGDSIRNPGQSLERKAKQGDVCVSSQSAGEFLGNGCDSDDAASNFEIRSAPNPQNSKSLPEPRPAPGAPASLNTSSSIASYDQLSKKILFGWRPSKDVFGATSTLSYKIFAADPSSTVLLGEVTATGFTHTVTEFGKTHRFSLQAFDRDGLGSAATSASVEVPSLPPSASVLFAQNVSDLTSRGSHYNDNWYQLGKGFLGTLKSFTFRGMVSDADFSASRIRLNEFRDPAYTRLVRTYTLSQDAPIVHKMATTTIGNLSIKLKPYFYYRLDTSQGYQNRSVILAGTATSTACSEQVRQAHHEPCRNAMWNEFVYGTGRVEHIYPFTPFMVGEGEAATSTTQPPLAAPGNPVFGFDPLNLSLGFSWASSTDPDWPENPIRYEINHSTSTALAAAGWQPVGRNISASIPLVFKNSYTVGLRALDDFGKVSSSTVATWNFPDGYVPYILSSHLGSASQDFILQASGTIRSLDVFIKDFATGSRNPAANTCSLSLHEVESTTTALIARSPTRFGGDECAGELSFKFGASSTLAAGRRYRWIFSAETGNPSTQAAVRFFGTTADTARGAFSDSQLKNAKFRLVGDRGVLFEN